MGIMRNQQQWQTVVEQQQASGLIIKDYCQQHQLSVSSFYAARKKINLPSSRFVQAKIVQQVEITQELPTITLTIGQTNVTLPPTTSAQYLSQLLNGLTR